MSNEGEVHSECPSCGILNEISAAGVPNFISVSCSHCGHELGAWADLVEAERKAKTERPTTAPYLSSGLERHSRLQ